MAPSSGILQGTLDLRSFGRCRSGPITAWASPAASAQITQGTFDVKPGSLFPALHRLEEQGWLASEWGESENKRRAKFYELTKPGRRHLDAETASWELIAGAIKAAIAATS